MLITENNNIFLSLLKFPINGKEVSYLSEDITEINVMIDIKTLNIPIESGV